MTSDPRSSEPLTDEDDGSPDTSDDAPGSKGFFGRVLSALTGSERSDDGQADGVPSAQGAPGLGNLRRMRVGDVASPKVEIVAADITASLDDLVVMFREHGFSRMPVYRGTLDHPLGMIHLKDLALKHGFGAGGEFALRPMLRPLLYVPPSMGIGVLLQQMQSRRIHMALVIDEYGGVDGLLTIENVIEQVIGQIEDEHDEEQGGPWIQEADGQWLIQARADLDAVEAETGLTLAVHEDADIDTLGGLIFLLAGRVPLQGEVISHPSGAEFEVVEADTRRLKRIRLRMPGPEATADRAAG